MVNRSNFGRLGPGLSALGWLSASYAATYLALHRDRFTTTGSFGAGVNVTVAGIAFLLTRPAIQRRLAHRWMAVTTTVLLLDLAFLAGTLLDDRPRGARIWDAAVAGTVALTLVRALPRAAKPSDA